MMRMAVIRRSLSGSRMSLANHSLPLRSGFAERKSTISKGRFLRVSRRHGLQVGRDQELLLLLPEFGFTTSPIACFRGERLGEKELKKKQTRIGRAPRLVSVAERRYISYRIVT